MKNVLVSGGAGYIGSHIIELLLKKNFKVYILDNLSTGHKILINKKAKFFKLDIGDSQRIKNIIAKYKIDSVIHLAAKTNIAEAERKPKEYFKNNITSTLKFVKACKDSKIKNFLFSSSCAVYQRDLKFVSEKSKTKTKGIYGGSKLRGEKIVRKFFNKKNYNFAILRYFNVVGASPSKKIGQITKNDQLFKNLSIQSIKKNPTFKIYGNDYNTFDGTCVRDFIHVYDLADLHIKILTKVNSLNKSVILNCGYGKGISVLQVINEFKKFKKEKTRIIYYERRSGDIIEMVANVKKLKKFIKWNPKFDNLKKMVKSSIHWERKLIDLLKR